MGSQHEPPPAAGTVDFGTLQRVSPVSDDFGFDRGLPIDRYYIESFLRQYATDIRGSVLEIKEPLYTKRFGGNRVVNSDVLHAEPGNPQATLVGDLTQGDHLPSERFDCIIFSQTLQYIYDARAAVRTLYRLLRPSGVLLLTVPGITQISSYDMERWGQYWSFTTRSTRRLLEEAFVSSDVIVQDYGNVLAAISFLHGIAVEELPVGMLDVRDANYQVTITARALKRP